jgi:hypothetical protein
MNSARETAERIIEDGHGCAGLAACFRETCTCAAAIAAAITDAVTRETERCCKAVCPQCRAGYELIEHRAVSGRVTGYTHRWLADFGTTEMTSGCSAAAIRARQ